MTCIVDKRQTKGQFTYYFFDDLMLSATFFVIYQLLYLRAWKRTPWDLGYAFFLKSDNLYVQVQIQIHLSQLEKANKSKYFDKQHKIIRSCIRVSEPLKVQSRQSRTLWSFWPRLFGKKMCLNESQHTLVLTLFCRRGWMIVVWNVPFISKRRFRESLIWQVNKTNR